ncbi:RND family transporter [Pseudomonas sp. SCB32]|uniref:efflux RND transporter permease subunit n=1 Tax=Pseudomonas sp. SCB32 TaxID=2653853 RepID=UPI001265A381|nr:efflux RND transporter permease subunit [Pseudomonas sp. SCB32]
MSAVPTRTERLVAALARGLIARRKVLGLLFVLITLGLGASALHTRLDPGFNKLIPLSHPFMAAFREHGSSFSGANRILVDVHWKGPGDIYNREFLEVLRKVTDEVFFTPGVNRSRVRSLFTPSVRYIEVTEAGFTGDVVVPSHFVADATGLAQIRTNVAKSGEIGQLVANDLRSAMIQADLLEVDPQTGQKLDYAAVAKRLESIRARYGNEQIDIRIVGFAKIMGEVMAGLNGVLAFFAIAFVITTLLLWVYCRSLKLTLLAICVALLPVIWLLGLLPLLGYGIDPMSVLVPFLIFSIGVSHAVQMTNAWKQDVLAGATPREAAEAAFRKLAIPGTVALLANALGFMVIMLIDIPIVRELGLTACLGVGLMVVTNKMFLPIILSHLQLERAARQRTPAGQRQRVWWALSALAEPGPALLCLAGMLVLLAVGTYESRFLRIGDIGAGAPELRAESRYNRDNAAIVGSYSISMDVLSVYAETTGLEEACLNWEVMNAVERLDLFLRGVAGVQSVRSVAGGVKLYVAGNNEANPRWAALQRSEAALRIGGGAANPELGLNNEGCHTINVQVYLDDHQGSTLKHVTEEVQRFIAAEHSPRIRFRLAGGNAGVAAATNEAVEQAEVQMLASIFVAITLLCWVTFRSWRGVLCVIVPLMLVTILCNALMALLGIGLKVATLPVIALGVGVGVDYGVYLFERVQHELGDGRSLREAFYEALRQRGTAAAFTAVTMSIGVGTWAFSALKFQADMGVLLAFMFLVNVLGAIFLLPALAVWLGVGQREAPAMPVGGGVLDG